MREISMKVRTQVIRLFFTGLSYDQISRETGVSKGGIVNIISDYREGRKVLTEDITECIDELRRVAVDMRKQNTNISQVMSCTRIYTRVMEMGVSNESLEQWLDICWDIVSPDLSGKQFVAAALELARTESQTGLTYQEIVNEYKEKLASSKELDKEIETKEKQWEETYLKYEREEKNALTNLDSITAAIVTAEKTFRNQKEELKAQLDEYLARNNLSWKKVNTAVALFNSELRKLRFTKKDTENLAEQISNTGSLIIHIRKLENSRDGLYGEIEKLKRAIEDYNSRVMSLQQSYDKLRHNIDELNQVKAKIEQRIGEIEVETESKRDELRNLILTMDEVQHNFRITELFIGFLSSPEFISDFDLDQLVGLMIAIRQKRKGIYPMWRIDNRGNTVFECIFPEMFKNSRYLPNIDIEGIRNQLATYLFPIVKDKFITKKAHELEMQKIRKEHELTLRQSKREHEFAMKQYCEKYKKAAEQAVFEVIRLVGSKK